jgi:hypothetical protein
MKILEIYRESLYSVHAAASEYGRHILRLSKQNPTLTVCHYVDAHISTDD